MAHVLGEIEWCLEHAEAGQGQLFLLPEPCELAA